MIVSESVMPRVAVIMGSRSDWDVMSHCVDMLSTLGVECEVRVISAHRAPDALFSYVEPLESRGFEAIVAGAGLAAPLAGLCAAKTLLPVFGVPLPAGAFEGMDALLAIVQMPAGVPVGTMAVGKAGAVNAALMCVAQIARKDARVREAWARFREEQTRKIEAIGDPRDS